MCSKVCAKGKEVQQVYLAYDIIVHCDIICFLFLLGKWAKVLLRSWLDYLMPIGTTDMCSLLLQRPHQSARTPHVIAGWKRHVDLRAKGEVKELF